MTSRADGADAADHLHVPTPQLVLGYVSLRHSIRSSARTALAYSNIRRIWWPLAYIDLPFLFLLFGGVIALNPCNLVSHGVASCHLDRADPAGSVKVPRKARLMWLIFAIEVAVVFAIIPTGLALIVGPGPSSLVMLAWWLVILGVPLIGYVLPALVRSYRDRGISTWRVATFADTGRPVAFVSMLASWPCAGGGRKGIGDGFELMRALAAEVRSHGQIMVGAARTTDLAAKYVAFTGAQPSADQPRHLRWP